MDLIADRYYERTDNDFYGPRTVRDWISLVIELRKLSLKSESLHTRESSTYPKVEQDTGVHGVCLCTIKLKRMLCSVVYLPRNGTN